MSENIIHKLDHFWERRRNSKDFYINVCRLIVDQDFKYSNVMKNMSKRHAEVYCSEREESEDFFRRKVSDGTWNTWRSSNSSPLDLSNVNFPEICIGEINFAGVIFHRFDFSGLKAKSLVFNKCYLEHCSFTDVSYSMNFVDNCYIRDVEFLRIHNIKILFQKATLETISMMHFEEVELLLDNTKIKNCVFEDIKGTKAHFDAINAVNVKFVDFSNQNTRLFQFKSENVSLIRCDFFKGSLEDSRFRDGYIKSTNLERVNLTKSEFPGLKISSGNNLKNLIFSAQHDPLNDDSNTIKWHWWFGWEAIKILGRLPLFGISWATLAITLIIITGVGYLNETMLINTINYPIPLPSRMLWLLVSSIMLVIGTTLYQLFCPAEVKEYSSAAWVLQLGRPKLLYIAHQLSFPFSLRAITGLFLVFGALVSLALCIERAYEAIPYLIKYFSI